jgi:hypothetical protein
VLPTISARGIYGDLKIEVLDADGKLLDTVPASKRRGLNRVAWAMRAKPPLVPPAASVAGFSTQGPRLVPGTYTVRMTKNKKVYETKLVVDLDRRADYTVQDRKLQFAAAQRVSGMFGEISGLMMRINELRGSSEMLLEKTEDDAKLTLQLKTLSDKADEIRKRLSRPRNVATSPRKSGSARTWTIYLVPCCKKGSPAKHVGQGGRAAARIDSASRVQALVIRIRREPVAQGKVASH